MKQHIFTLLVLSLLMFGCSHDEKGAPEIQKLSTKQERRYSDTFDTKNPAWEQEEGLWVFIDHGVMQTEKDARFPLLLLKKEIFAELDVSVKFKPLSGRIDASGGIVFRAQDDENYYIVRANALEDNFRLYYFKDGLRYEIASATVVPPPMKKYSTIRVVARGDHIQAYLNGKLEIDHHDSLYARGFVGLWTKADSVTEFDDFRVSGD